MVAALADLVVPVLAGEESKPAVSGLVAWAADPLAALVWVSAESAVQESVASEAVISPR